MEQDERNRFDLRMESNGGLSSLLAIHFEATFPRLTLNHDFTRRLMLHGFACAALCSSLSCCRVGISGNPIRISYMQVKVNFLSKKSNPSGNRSEEGAVVDDLAPPFPAGVSVKIVRGALALALVLALAMALALALAEVEIVVEVVA